jgi:hypothetical protein
MQRSARSSSKPLLGDAFQLVHLYAEHGSPKFEKAAMRWLARFLMEGSQRLQRFAGHELAMREPD